MRIYFLLFTTLLSFNILAAQGNNEYEEIKRPYVEFGFDATGILKHLPFIPAGNANLQTASFVFKIRNPNRHGSIRFGFGGTVGVGDANVNEIFQNIGYESVYNIGKKWRYYWGADAIMFGQRNVGVGVGAGPILGIKYDANAYISFFTEGAVYLKAFIGNNSGLQISARPPNSLFMSVKFHRK